MNQMLTYYDFKDIKRSKIFEAEEIKGLSEEQIAEAERTYNLLVEKLQKGEEISEGLFSGILGAAGGALVGPAIGRAICHALGIDENGTFGKLLTSRLVTAAIGYALAKG
jgi:hypothetical protein